MITDERLDLADDVAVMSELEVGLDPLLEGDEPQLFETPYLGLRELLEREFRQRRSSPQGERPSEELAPLLRSDPAGVVQLNFEATCVDLLGACAEDVSGRPRLEDVGPELLS
jgi:hypothetical protein